MKKLWFAAVAAILLCSAVAAERPWRTMSDQRLEQEIQRGINSEVDWKFELLEEFHERHCVDNVVIESPPGILWGLHAQIRAFDGKTLKPGSESCLSKRRVLEGFYQRYIETRRNRSITPWKNDAPADDQNSERGLERPLMVEQLSDADLELQLRELYKKRSLDGQNWIHEEDFSDEGFEEELLSEFHRRRAPGSELSEKAALRDFYRTQVLQRVSNEDLVHQLQEMYQPNGRFVNSYWEFELLNEFFRRYEGSRTPDDRISADESYIKFIGDNVSKIAALRQFFKRVTRKPYREGWNILLWETKNFTPYWTFVVGGAVGILLLLLLRALARSGASSAAGSGSPSGYSPTPPPVDASPASSYVSPPSPSYSSSPATDWTRQETNVPGPSGSSPCSGSGQGYGNSYGPPPGNNNAGNMNG